MSLHDAEFDQKYKDELFESITLFSHKINEFNRLIAQSSKYTDINFNLPNIANNLNNKLILEIFPRFEKANLNFGSTSSMLGEAIMFDLIERTTDGVKSLENYSTSLYRKQETSLAKVSPLRNFFSRFRILFTGNFLTKEQLKNAKISLKEYKSAAKSISNYSLEKDLPASLFSYFKDNSFPRNTILEILEDDINPSLEKLDLASLIPILKTQTLNEKDNNKNEFLSKLRTSSRKINQKSTYKPQDMPAHDDLYK